MFESEVRSPAPRSRKLADKEIIAASRSRFTGRGFATQFITTINKIPTLKTNCKKEPPYREPNAISRAADQ
jgi:hypothetical protein